jgi:hypothetical protein
VLPSSLLSSSHVHAADHEVAIRPNLKEESNNHTNNLLTYMPPIMKSPYAPIATESLPRSAGLEPRSAH